MWHGTYGLSDPFSGSTSLHIWKWQRYPTWKVPRLKTPWWETHQLLAMEMWTTKNTIFRKNWGKFQNAFDLDPGSILQEKNICLKILTGGASPHSPNNVFQARQGVFWLVNRDVSTWIHNKTSSAYCSQLIGWCMLTWHEMTLDCMWFVETPPRMNWKSHVRSWHHLLLLGGWNDLSNMFTVHPSFHVVFLMVFI